MKWSDVICPRCGRDPGQACVERSRELYPHVVPSVCEPHQERIARAKQGGDA